MIAVASLLIFLSLALLITRVATTSLRATGLSHEAARFQARSAFSGVGFTTAESEAIVNHPVRRNIVLMLMLLSTAGIVTTVTSLLLSFVHTSGYHQAALRLAALLAGLLVLWAFAASAWVEARLSRIIEWALARWTDLDVRDYVRLLEISGNYAITEMSVDPDDWLAERRIDDLLLRQEGVVVLGIRHADGNYMGAPPPATLFRPGDTLVVYGRATALDELQQRKIGPAGDRAHERAVIEHEDVVVSEGEAYSRRRRRRVSAGRKERT